MKPTLLILSVFSLALTTDTANSGTAYEVEPKSTQQSVREGTGSNQADGNRQVANKNGRTEPIQTGSKKNRKQQQSLAIKAGNAPGICPEIAMVEIRSCEDNYAIADAADECLYRMEESAIIAANALQDLIKQRSANAEIQTEIESKQSKLYDTSADDYKQTEQITVRLRNLGQAALKQMIQYRLKVEYNKGEDAEFGEHDGACYEENAKEIEKKIATLKKMIQSTESVAETAKLFKIDTDNDSTIIQEKAAKNGPRIQITDTDGNVIAEGDSADEIYFRDAETAADFKKQREAERKHPGFAPVSSEFSGQ